MNAATRSGRLQTAAPADADQEALSLPAWIYHDPEFFEVEKETVFRTSWQLVCHVNDVPRPGDFHTFDFLGESVVVLRGEAHIRIKRLDPCVWTCIGDSVPISRLDVCTGRTACCSA